MIPHKKNLLRGIESKYLDQLEVKNQRKLVKGIGLVHPHLHLHLNLPHHLALLLLNRQVVQGNEIYDIVAVVAVAV